MARILFVCTGNTCRSTMAEALALYFLESMGQGGAIEIASAGLAACAGLAASSQAMEVMAERGLDLSGHRARPLTRELASQADLILTMTQAHRQQLAAAYPELAAKVHVLKEYAGLGRDQMDSDILDPFGGSIAEYRCTARELEEAVAAALKRFLADKR